MDEAGNIGLTVMFIRKIRGWSQKELAKAAGMHQSDISIYERGLECPTRATLERLATAAGLPFSAVEEYLAFVRRVREDLDEMPPPPPASEDVETVVESVTRTLSEAVAGVVRPAATELLANVRRRRTAPA